MMGSVFAYSPFGPRLLAFAGRGTKGGVRHYARIFDIHERLQRFIGG